MDYSNENVKASVVAELFKYSKKMSAFAELAESIHHVDTRIHTGVLRIQGWIPLDEFKAKCPQKAEVELVMAMNDQNLEIWCWSIPLWYFHKSGAYEVARKIPHSVLTENDFKL